EVGGRGRPPILKAFSLINHSSPNHGQQDFSLSDLERIDIENVLRNHNQVSQLAWFERAFGLFTTAGERGIQCVSLNGIRKTDALRGNPTTLRLAFGRLAGHCVLNPLPWAESDHRPVAAKRNHSACGLNAAKRPGALGALGAYIRRPGLERIVVWVC